MRQQPRERSGLEVQREMLVEHQTIGCLTYMLVLLFLANIFSVLARTDPAVFGPIRRNLSRTPA
jgi:hypothetical protein